MSDSLRRFQNHKKMFSWYCTDKKVRAPGKTHMIAQREDELGKPGLSTTQNRNITTRCRSRIVSAKTSIFENGEQFNSPKMDAMRHFVP
jgi:hypothetical protein